MATDDAGVPALPDAPVDEDTPQAPVQVAPRGPVPPRSPLPPDPAQQFARQQAALLGQVQQAQGDLNTQVGALRQQYEPAIAGQRDALTKATGTYAEVANQPLNLQQPGAPPNLSPHHLPVAVAVGTIVAGLLAGRAAGISPMMTAADSFTKANEAFKTNDYDRRQAALEQYKTSVDAIRTYNDNLKSERDAILEAAKSNVALADQMLNTTLAAYADGVANARQTFADKVKTLDTVIKANDQAWNMNERHWGNLVASNDRNRALDARAAAASGKGRSDTLPKEYLKSMFGMDEQTYSTALSGMKDKEAAQFADAVDGIRQMDRLSRSLTEDPGLGRTVNQLAARASGSLDNFIGLTQSSQDAKVQAFGKSLILLRRQGALLLAGDRGITVGGERIANRLLEAGATSPGGIAQVAREFARDTKAKYTKWPGGVPIDWSAVQPLPTMDDPASDAPLIGPGAGSAEQPPPAAAASPPAQPGGTPEFVRNKVYVDKDGNRATYLGGDPNDPKSWR